MSGNLNLNSNKIVNLATPTLSTDAVTKAYVDTADALSLLKASNLSDVANVTTSRTNLSAAKSGANTDITSLTGLTTPLSVAQGGTGAATLTSNNVLLGNGTSALQVVAPSTSCNVLTSNGTTWTSVAGAYPLTSGTAVASTSGTSIDFTSIPSWVKRITVMLNGVSTNGTSNLLIRLGTAGGIQTSTYSGGTWGGQNVGSVGLIAWATGIELQHGAIVDTADILRGTVVINLIDSSSNTWSVMSTLYRSGATASYSSCAGNIVLSGVTTTIRITTANGTDTFDAGSINILYE
jgi:hypothetical protein